MPIQVKTQPEQNQIESINDDHPATTLPVKYEYKVQIKTQKATTKKEIPKPRINRISYTEKEVMP